MTRTLPAGGPYESVVEAMELPRIVALGGNLYAAVFSLMKLLPARHIVDRARASGALRPGATVIETSSGSFGLGLALVCRLRGHPLVMVGDPAIEPSLRTRLELLGARVELVDGTSGPGGVQGNRLARVAQLQEQHPGSFVPGQYDNPDNPAAYRVVADLLAESLGTVDRLVGPVGSGGSTGGVTGALRRGGLPTALVGVDTPGSVIFGAQDRPRLLRGLGSSIHPGNVQYRAYDEVHWVSAAAAFHAARRLYTTHGVFAGPTSGASYLVARWCAAAAPDEVTVALFPDDGHRYLETVYRDAWLRRHGVWPPVVPAGPALVDHPGAVDGDWSYLLWHRREPGEALRQAVTG